MERIQSLWVRNVVFGALCAVFVLLLALRRDATRPSDDTAGTGPAFAAIQVDKVVAIEVEQTTKVDGKPTKQAVRLVRASPTVWKLASAFDHPAVTATVENWLKGLSRAKQHSVRTSNAEKFASFAGTDGFVDVRIFESEGTPSLSFGIGKANSEGGYASKRFVRLDDPTKAGAGRVLDVSDLDGADSLTSATYWVETRLLPTLTAADVAELTVEQGAAHRPITFVRGKKPEKNDADKKDGDKKDAAAADKDKEDPWTVAAPKPEPAASETVMGLVRGFVGMSLASIEAGKIAAADEAKYGFDKPDLVLRGTGKSPADASLPPTWTLHIGKKVEGKSAWYVRRSTGEADDPFVFTVNDYELTDFRKDPEQFLQKKPEPPAPAAPGMDTAPGMDAAPAMDAPPGSPPAAPTAPTPPPAPPAPAPATPAMDAPPGPGTAPTPPAMEPPPAPAPKDPPPAK